MQPEPEGGLAGIPPAVKIGGVVVIAAIAYYLYRNHQANANSANSSTSSSSTPYGQPATGTGVLEPILIQTGPNAPVTASASATGPVTNINPTPAGTGSQFPKIKNKYPVGTKVSDAKSPFGAQTVIESLPVDGTGWISLTSEGGLYGTGLNAKGSPFRKGSSGWTMQLNPSGKAVDVFQNGKFAGVYKLS